MATNQIVYETVQNNILQTFPAGCLAREFVLCKETKTTIQNYVCRV